MMNGHEKSHPAIVAAKSPNKSGQPGAEAMEPRVGAEENASRQSTHRTLSRERVTQALERVRQSFAVRHPRWEPYALIGHVRIYAGGAQ
jgi:RNA-directed DNA polymerase